MLTCEGFESVSYVLFTSDLLAPILGQVSIKFIKPNQKPVSNYIKTVNVNADQLENNILILEFCVVEQIYEDLPNGKIYLPYFGEYQIEVYSGTDLIWKDLAKYIGSDIKIYTP